MEMKIIKQEKNPFMDREELILEFVADVTPSFDEVKTALKKDANLTVVKKVSANFGRKTFVAEAVVYNSREAMKNIEVIPKKIRKKMEAEEKAAAESAKKAAAEAKKAEEAAKAAAEETKEEVSAE